MALISYVCALKESNFPVKVTNQKEVWPSYWEKEHDPGMLSFPFICVNSEKIIRRINPVQTEFRVTFHGVHHHSTYLQSRGEHQANQSGFL